MSRRSSRCSPAASPRPAGSPGIAASTLPRPTRCCASSSTRSPAPGPGPRCTRAPPDVPVELLVGAGFTAISFDLSLAHPDDVWAESFEKGIDLWLGVVPSTDAERHRRRCDAGRAFFGRFGFDEEAYAQRLVVTPTCGLAGASPAWARQALSRKASPAHQRIAEKTETDDGDDPAADGEGDVAVEDPGHDDAGDEEHDADDGVLHPLGSGEMVGHDVLPFGWQPCCHAEREWSPPDDKVDAWRPTT